MELMSHPERQRPQRATFRLPAPALLFPALLMFCVTPLATSGGAWAVVFVIPVLALAWVVVTRTKATSDGVTAYGLLGAKRMPWTDLAGLEFNDARWAIAVGLDGSRVRLPMVRPRDLPRLVAVSGGSLRLGPDAPSDDGGSGGSGGDAGAAHAEAGEADSGGQEHDGPVGGGAFEDARHDGVDNGGAQSDARAPHGNGPGADRRAGDGADNRGAQADRAGADGAEDDRAGGHGSAADHGDIPAARTNGAAPHGAVGPTPGGTGDHGALAGNAPSADRLTGRQCDIPADPGRAVR